MFVWRWSVDCWTLTCSYMSMSRNWDGSVQTFTVPDIDTRLLLTKET
jgi:hypothetical protein